MVYLLTLKPRGSLGTPIRSDTLFGHACWAVKFNPGIADFDEFLADARAQKPAVVFSAGMPHGYLPRPLVPVSSTDKTDAKTADQLKKLKRVNWIRRNTGEAASWRVDTKMVPGPGELENQQPHTRIVMRNIIDRSTGTSLSEHGLYPLAQTWYGQGIWESIDIYVSTTWTVEKLMHLMQCICDTGYGRDQSTGMGRLDLIDGPKPAKIAEMSADSLCMSLSNGVPCNSINLEHSYYKLEPKYGKVWSGLTGPNPFKKALLTTAPGSVFACSKPAQIYGRVLENVHESNKDVIENCMLIPYPLPREVLDA